MAEDAGTPSLSALAEAVDALLSALEAERAALRATLAKVRKLESDLARLEAGAREPARLHRELQDAEARGDALEERVLEAREAVDRLLSRVRFLEDQQP
jgi:predicted RNase H-like nuclease (RuvC/YqgF family)